MKRENKDKENALTDFIEMVKGSWSYHEFTEEEKYRFKQLDWVFNRIKGSYWQRWEQMNNIYHAFIEGIGGTEVLMKRQEKGEAA